MHFIHDLSVFICFFIFALPQKLIDKEKVGNQVAVFGNSIVTDGDFCPVEFVYFRHDKAAVPATFFKLVVVPFLFVVEAETCAGRT